MTTQYAKSARDYSAPISAGTKREWAAVPAPKIGVPALPRGFIARRLMMTDIVRAAQAKVMLVCAPAGYGKTTLLSRWAEERNADGRRAVGWLCLDPYDNDPFRLWSGVLG